MTSRKARKLYQPNLVVLGVAIVFKALSKLFLEEKRISIAGIDEHFLIPGTQEIPSSPPSPSQPSLQHRFRSEREHCQENPRPVINIRQN
jgi:hypothetical protein